MMKHTSMFYYDRMANSTPTNENIGYYNEIQLDDGKWTREQTQILIDTWKDNKYTLLNTASSTAEHFKIWKIIASEVNKLSPPKSLQQCKKKFRNIRYICKTAINNNEQSGSKKHYPLFYSDFVEIISESDRIKEGLKCEASQVEVTSEPLEHRHDEEPNPHENPNGMPRELLIKRESYSNKNFLNHAVNKTSSFSLAENNYHDDYEAHLHHSGDNSTSPSLNTDNDRVESEEFQENSKRNYEEQFEGYYSDDKASHTNNSDTFLRKHKHIDVSIMGRSYPPSKRVRSNPESVTLLSSYQPSPLLEIPSVITSRTENYPTMASLSHDQETFKTNSASAALTSVARKLASTNKSASTPIPISSRSVLNNKHSYPASCTTPENTITKNDSRDRFNERFLDVQERQMEIFSSMLNRHEQFLLRLLEQQREAAEKAQKRDREFMLKLVEMFVSSRS